MLGAGTARDRLGVPGPSSAGRTKAHPCRRCCGAAIVRGAGPRVAGPRFRRGVPGRDSIRKRPRCDAESACRPHHGPANSAGPAPISVPSDAVPLAVDAGALPRRHPQQSHRRVPQSAPAPALAGPAPRTPAPATATPRFVGSGPPAALGVDWPSRRCGRVDRRWGLLWRPEHRRPPPATATLSCTGGAGCTGLDRRVVATWQSHECAHIGQLLLLRLLPRVPERRSVSDSVA